MQINWETPSKVKSGRGKYAELAKALQERPGEWALVGEDMPATTATYLKSTYGLEATVRDVSNGRAKVYARFVTK